MNQTILTADRSALQHILQVQPVLTALSNAGTTLGLAPKELLHAGPPILDKKNMARPIANSAIAAILFEGWADDIEQATQLLYSDQITLTPAQDKNTAIPLADVLSPNMCVLHVEDAKNPHHIAYSSINGGDGPVTRVGMLHQDVVDRLHWIYGPIAKTITKLLEKNQPDLLPIAQAAILKGDDLHGRTAQASALLYEKLTQGIEVNVSASQEQQFIEKSAAFFLNVWMAACLCSMLSAEKQAYSSAIIRMGSNGKEFGLQVAGLPGQWFTAPAQAPFIPDSTDEIRQRALGAIGDSAVVDAMGYGAMLQSYAPETASRLQRAAQQSQQSIPIDLLHSKQPAFDLLNDFRTGLTAQSVLQANIGPVVSLGVLDAHGEKGRLDGGFFFTPIAPFANAIAAISKG